MKYSEFISKLTLLESGKSEVKVGDMRETLRRLKELIKDEEAFEYFIHQYLKLQVQISLK